MVGILKERRRPLGPGVRDWLLQKITSVIIMAYSIVICLFWMSHAEIGFSSWKALFQHPGMQLLSSLFLISLCGYSWVGLWGVVTDYIKPPVLRSSIQIILLVLNLLYLMWGLFIVWGL